MDNCPCEVILFHHKDIGIPWEIANIGVHQGMWGAVKNIELGVTAIDIQSLWRGISCSFICRSTSSKCLCILSTPAICWNCFFFPC